jgi:hypothetical protein
MPTPKQQNSLPANDLVVQGDDLEPQHSSLLDRVKGFIDEKLAPRSTSPHESEDWSWGPAVDQASASLLDAVRGGVRNTIAPFLHPVDTAAGMGKAVVAGGMAPGGMYPIAAPTSKKQYEQQKADHTTSQDLQTSAIHDQAAAAKAMAANKADSVGGIIGPILAGEGIKSVGGRLSTAAEAAGGYKALARSKVTDVLAPGTPSDLLVRALKPPSTVPNPGEILDRSLPDVIRASSERPRTVSQFSSAADRARSYNDAAYRGIFNGENYAGRPIGETPVSTSPLADAIRKSVSPTHEFENGLTGSVDALGKKADFYANNEAPLTTVDDIRKTRNAELDNIFAASPADRASLIRANPDLAAKMAMRGAAADTVYETLSKESGIPEQAIRDNRNAYGDLRDTADIAGKRDTVYGRQNPVSLAEHVALNGPGRVRNFLFNKIFKDATGSDALVDAATRRHIAANPEPALPQTGRSGPGRPFKPAGLLGAPKPDDGIIDADVLPINDSALGNPEGWSADTRGAQVPIGTYKPPIGYPVGPDQITPPPARTLELPPPANDFMTPAKRGPIQLGPGPQPTAEVLGPGSSKPQIAPRSKLPEAQTAETGLPGSDLVTVDDDSLINDIRRGKK